MFKYLRTLNSDSHPTEIYSFFSPKSEHGAVNAGTLISLSFGEVASTTDREASLYLAISSKGKDEDAYVKCIKLCSGMVFEADIDSDDEPSGLYVGARCTTSMDLTFKGAYATTLAEASQVIFEILEITDFDNGKAIVAVI